MKYRRFIFNLLCTITAFVCLISMYVYPDIIKNSAKQALSICVYSLIPALFPYITCTRILCEFTVRFIKNKNAKSAKTLGFSRAGLIAHLLGLIAGFPSGAVIAADFYKSGAISKSEAEKLIAYSNCISPAFCIIIVGKEIIGSYLCGIVLFVSVLISNCLSMLISGKNLHSESAFIQHTEISKNKTGISAIIKDCSVVMLNICAFVTFFICIGNLVIYVLGNCFVLSDEIKVIVSSALEISAGTVRLSGLGFGKKVLLGSMLISFGGISAIMQVMSICDKYSLSAKKFFISKILSALFSPIVTFLFFAILPEWIFNSLSVGKSLFLLLPKLLLIFTSLLLFLTFILFYRRKMIKNRS